MMTVLICAAYGYAESCSSGQGSLSYQISGCGEQRRACCSGTWCSWGTTSCASCTATTQACSGNVSGACAGTQTRTRTVAGTCGSCSYNSGTIQNYNYGPTLRTVSCSDKKRETIPCTTIKNYMPYDTGAYSNFCSGTASASFTLEDNCGSCTYRLNSWDATCTCCLYIWRTHSGRYSTLAECNSQRSYIMNNAMTQYTTSTSCNSYSTHGKYKTGSMTACSAIGNGYGFSYQRCTCSDF